MNDLMHALTMKNLTTFHNVRLSSVIQHNNCSWYTLISYEISGGIEYWYYNTGLIFK